MQSDLSFICFEPNFKKLSVDFQGEVVTDDLINELKQRFFNDEQVYPSLALNFKNANVLKLAPQNLLSEKQSQKLKNLTMNLSGVNPGNLAQAKLLDRCLYAVSVVSISFYLMENTDRIVEFVSDILKQTTVSALRLKITQGKMKVPEKIAQERKLPERLRLLLLGPKRITILSLDMSRMDVNWGNLAKTLSCLYNLTDLTIKSEYSNIKDSALKEFSDKFSFSTQNSLTLMLKHNPLTSEAVRFIKDRISREENELNLEFLWIELDNPNETDEKIAENSEMIKSVCEAFPDKLQGQCLLKNKSFKIGKYQGAVEAKQNSLTNPLFPKEEKSLLNIDATIVTKDTKCSQNDLSYSQDEIINCFRGTLKINKEIILGIPAEEKGQKSSILANKELKQENKPSKKRKECP